MGDSMAKATPDGPYNLREVERIAADGVEDQVLQLIHDAEEVIAQGRHGAVEPVRKTGGLLGRFGSRWGVVATRGLRM